MTTCYAPINPPSSFRSFIPGGFEPRPFGFPDIGRGDLDPLGRGGSGNLFAFPSRPNMGPGPLPRFDPFSPLNPNVPGQGGFQSKWTDHSEIEFPFI